MELITSTALQKKSGTDTFQLPFALQPDFLLSQRGIRILMHNGFIAPIQFISNKGFKTARFLFPPVDLAGQLTEIEAEKEFTESAIQLVKRNKLAHRFAQPYNFCLFRHAPARSRAAEYGTYRVILENRTETDIFQSMQARYRTAINQVNNMKPVIRTGADELNAFCALHQETMLRSGIAPESLAKMKQELSSCEKHTLLANVYIDGQIQGGLFLYYSGHGAYYMHGASATTTQAQGAIKWLHYNIMCQMRRKGVKYYDFVGARLSDVAGTRLEGIQNFKRRFGAELIKGYLWKMDLDQKYCRAYDALLKLKCKIRKTEFPIDIIDQELKNEPFIMKIYILVGTRPNFIKVTQFRKCAEQLSKDIEIRIIHTGQHYDEKMADIFFRQFDLTPDHYLNISPLSANIQMSEIMEKLEILVNEIGKPDILLVPGDVNSTLAGALFANKSGIPLGHIEAGLRSFDRTMPEEFNRILTDELSDLYFVTEPSGMQHLLKEGKPSEKIHMVGNTMIDTMVAFEKEIDGSHILNQLELNGLPFILMTMHRPATVDNRSEFRKLLDLIHHLSKNYKIVFPVHPRTIKNSREFGLHDEMVKNTSLICTDPLDYFSFQKLIKHCSFIITDSGGIQEESTFRKKPCLTLRPNTERPVTVEVGTNTLLNFDIEHVIHHVKMIENGTYKKGNIPEYWDGRSTERILKILDSK